MPEFLVDRNLGRKIVPDALRARGFVVHTLWSVYGDDEQSLADADYLAEAGRRGWAVLSADMRVRWVRHELEVIERSRVRYFALTRGDLTGTDQAERLVANLSRIVRACERPGPFIYSVHADRLARKWP